MAELHQLEKMVLLTFSSVKKLPRKKSSNGENGDAEFGSEAERCK
jgi:hypothetical protein